MTEKMKSKEKCVKGEADGGQQEAVCRSCIDCGSTNCNRHQAAYPEFCVSQRLEEDIIEEASALYHAEEINEKIAYASASIESDFYCEKTRLEETALFAERIGAKKIGIATCVGLIRESRIVAKYYRQKGFEVYGTGCKVGEIDKSFIGLDQVNPCLGRSMCNPILQAKILNREKTDLNVIIGLCVGHDSLFVKYSEAPATTLVVKDRVLAHNPVGAIYQAEGYYKRKLFS